MSVFELNLLIMDAMKVKSKSEEWLTSFWSLKWRLVQPGAPLPPNTNTNTEICWSLLSVQTLKQRTSQTFFFTQSRVVLWLHLFTFIKIPSLCEAVLFHPASVCWLMFVYLTRHPHAKWNKKRKDLLSFRLQRNATKVECLQTISSS